MCVLESQRQAVILAVAVRCGMRSLIYTLGLVLLAVFSVAGQEAGDLLPHAPIQITGDELFTEENGVVGGSGTQEDPYLISGFIIDASGTDCGFLIDGTTRVFRIENCRIIGAKRYGIRLVSVESATVASCQVEDTPYGLMLKQANKTSVEQNIFLRSTKHAILIDNSNSNTIAGNLFVKGGVGLSLIGDQTGTLIYDNIFDHCGLGISILSLTGGNTVYRNDFIKCTASSLSFNIWDNGEEVGNYWSDYVGRDKDGDGVGDAPYPIKFLEQQAIVYTCWDYDYHPAMQPFHWKEAD